MTLPTNPNGHFGFKEEKSIIGNNVTQYGQVGIAQNIIIEDNVIALTRSGVSKKLQRGKTYFGYPASESQEKYRKLAALRRIGNKNKE